MGDAEDLGPLDECHTWLTYKGDARRLVAGVKYRNDRRVLGRLADGMADMLTPPPNAIVTWVPTTPTRRRERGFDQAELLAKALARRWGLRCRGLLVRSGRSHQTGRSRQERLATAAVLFVPRVRWPLERPAVLVDDVITTGATVRSAAMTLKQMQATWVAAVAAAQTP